MLTYLAGGEDAAWMAAQENRDEQAAAQVLSLLALPVQRYKY
jgi:hypothetical protein